jgi:hypothetical protein
MSSFQDFTKDFPTTRGHGSTFQMEAAYSAMVRSPESFPDQPHSGWPYGPIRGGYPTFTCSGNGRLIDPLNGGIQRGVELGIGLVD